MIAKLYKDAGKIFVELFIENTPDVKERKIALKGELKQFVIKNCLTPTAPCCNIVHVVLGSKGQIVGVAEHETIIILFDAELSYEQILREVS